MSRQPLSHGPGPKGHFSLSLFWKVLLLSSLLALVPLAVATGLAVDSATSATRELLQQNLLQLAKEAAQRTSYTLVSVDSDLSVMGELPLTKEAFVQFSHSQRRELYSDTDGKRQREDVPKYIEIAWYHEDGQPAVVVVDDQPQDNAVPFKASDNRWCETEDYVALSLKNPGEPIVTGLVGCHLSLSRYLPAEGRLGTHFSGGIRISKALTDEDGSVQGVATLLLSQIHLSWALESIRRTPATRNHIPMMVDRGGWVLAHPEPSHVKGGDLHGQIVESSRWEDRRAVKLDRLPSPAGQAYSSLLDGTAEGIKQAGEITESDGTGYVVAAYPVRAEIGPFNWKHPFGTVLVLASSEEAFAVTRTLARNLWLLFAGTVLLVLVGSIWMANHVSRPVRSLAQAAGKLAQGHDAPVAEDRRDEIGDLARAFNRMQEDLAVSREGLLRTERLAAIGRFVSGIIHETKNILAGLGNYVTLVERKVDPDTRDRIMPKMRRALQQMDILVVRLRELSLTPRFAETDLVEVLRHSVDLVENQARDRHINLVFELPEQLDLPRADGSLLGQVFLNLLINAVEACDRDGEIRIIAEQTDNEVIIRVLDSGQGLPEESVTDLMQPFFTTKSGGTGLGLYICSSIVTRHAGTLVLTNRPEGGAAAEIRLPAHNPSRQAGAPRVEM
jgi:signal transduction histidine kinase